MAISGYSASIRISLLAWGLFISSVSSAEALNSLYQGLFHLHNASTIYYSAVKSGLPFSESRERNSFDEALSQAEMAFGSGDIDASTAQVASNTVRLLRESGDYFAQSGYTYPVGDEEMEAGFEDLRASTKLLHPAGSALALPYETFDALSHAFHNYFAIQASIGGDILNPVISKFNVSTLVQDADLLLEKTLTENPDNQELKGTRISWEFIKGPMMKWQETEIVFLVKRYQDKILTSVISTMPGAKP